MSPAPESIRRAVIDVGTNSVKLLVAEVTADSIVPLLETSEQTRLGRGFYATHLLQPEAMKLTASVVAQFARQARELGACEIRPFATSAARDALNADHLVSAIRAGSGLELSIISGETEAEWAFCGASSTPALDGKLFLLLDVGGGSTEFILGQGGHSRFSRSFALGTVRTLETLTHSDPPTPAELARHRDWAGRFLRENVRPHLEPAMAREQVESGDPVLLAATGGTVSILAALELGLTTFDRERMESVVLTDQRVSGWVETLWSLPLVQRRQLPGLPPSRADVMLAGSVIFESVMRQFGFKELRVSTRGLRFAALRKLWSPGADQAVL
ncbi:MAG: Ppx/GppA family phosphatase [Verrucomicrobia bacterium]|nr:Ppx/GppA family phosphatase [Verrucomicrobiota bacterium]